MLKHHWLICIIVCLGACQNQTSKEQYVYQQPHSSILDIAISPDEKLLVTTSLVHCRENSSSIIKL